MTYKIALLVGLSLLSPALLPRVTADAQTDSSRVSRSTKVQDYLNALGKIANPTQSGVNIQSLSLTDIKHLAHLMYEAYAADAVDVRRAMNKQDQAMRKMLQTGKSVRPASEGQIALLPRMTRELPRRIGALAFIPYLLRLKVQSVERVQYTDSLSRMRFPQIRVHATVEEVLKGSTRFSSGDSLTYYYMTFWDGTSPNEFTPGHEYLVPLEPRTEYDNSYALLALMFELDQEFSTGARHVGDAGSYEVSGDTLSDGSNFFGLGRRCSWTTFKDSIAADIKTLKAW